MTPQDIALVQQTYERLDAHRTLFAQSFYDRLFSVNPNIALMFDRNMDQQIEHFRVMLYTAVYGISRAEELKPALRNLGRRHLRYGVRSADYAAFEAALLWAIQQFLGDGFSPEVEKAWRAFYRFLSETMREGVSRDASLPLAAPQAAKSAW